MELIHLETPRLENRGPLLIAGLREHYTAANMNEIPALWQRLAPHFGRIAGHVDHTAFGVVFDMGNGKGFDYVAGLPVSGFANLPAEFARISLPAHQCAIFPHHRHVSRLKDTITAIWRDWLPASGFAAAGAGDLPGLLEFYGEHFDPRTGLGDIEVWVPVVSVAGTPPH